MVMDDNSAVAPTQTLGADLLTGADEIAAYIGWPARRVYRAVEKNLIPYFKKGSLILARKSEIDAAFRSSAAQ